ncbi:MAG: PP2C family protein-serine/threonine phosphatase [Burkholderiales bacterium]
MREHNEDLAHLSGDGRIMIVADGMGGHAAGEVASALAIAAIVENLGAVLPSLADDDDGAALRQAIRAAMNGAQEWVMTAARSHEAKHGMGCTLILACIRGDTLYTCHVGDVRGYRWRGQEFRALTRDHSVVAELIAAGELSADQARGHPAKNEVLRAIGMPTGFDPDMNTCRLKPGDRVLLCSDGLWEMLCDQELAGIVGGDGSMRQIVTQLVDRANDSGGRDNISVVLYEHTARGKGSAAESQVTEAPSGKSA